MSKEIISQSVNETIGLGKLLASICRGGEVFTLDGELGAGKTHLTKGIGMQLGCSEVVHSPTFTLINEYPSPQFWLYHADFYRLNSENDVMGLGLDEYVDSNGIVVIEWANKFPSVLPEQRIELNFRVLPDDSRLIIIELYGDNFQDIKKWLSDLPEKILMKELLV